MDIQERINAYCQVLDPAAITESAKVLGRYPHSFRAVYGCAAVFYFGMSISPAVLINL